MPTKLLTTLTMGAGSVIVTGTSCSNTSVWPSAAVTVSSIGNNPELGKANEANAPVAGLGFAAPGANHAKVAAPVELEPSQNTTSCPAVCEQLKSAVGGSFTTVTFRVTVSLPALFITVRVTG